MRRAILILALAALALLPTGAWAAVPAATSGATKDVAVTAGTLTGSVDPQGEATSYHFEYGTSTAYGLSTAAGDAGSGSAAVAVEAALANLTTNTTYHYRLVASNASGTDRGADRTFTTRGAPAASTSAAQGVSTTGARLRASVDANGFATTYHFEYGTTTGYGASTPERAAGSSTSARTVSETVSRLRAFTVYHYRVVATSPAGVARGADRVFTTSRSLRLTSVAATPNPATWSGSTKLSGRVTGSGSGGALVALERQDFPFTTPPRPVGTRRASSNGSFSFTVGPLWALARLRLSAGSATQVVEVRNALRVGLRTQRLSGGRVRLQGAVSPAVSNARASLQKRSPRGRWVVVRRAGVRPLAGNRSRYRFTVRRAGTYRVVVLPRDAFAHVRGTSREQRIRGARGIAAPGA